MSNKQQYYDDLYSLHQRGERICQHSIHDLKKAKKRLFRVFHFLKIVLPPQSKVLDVGCGLGYYTEALHQCGFSVTGIDLSKIAIESSRQRFSGPDFKCAGYPQDINESFDLIWAVDLSLINSFDMNVMDSFIAASLQRLNPHGVLIIGWHSDFSGESKDNFAQWDLKTLRNFRRLHRLKGPIIVEAKCRLFNFLLIHICRLTRKSAPIFLALKT